MKWLWAAYRMGTWDMPEGLTREEFYDTVVGIIASADLDWTLEVKSENGLRPVGIVLANYRFDGNGIETHVDWFPWATPRQKLETVTRFFVDVGKQHKVFVYAKQEAWKFFERIHQLKVIKKACKIVDAFGAGDDAMMYYTPGPF